MDRFHLSSITQLSVRRVILVARSIFEYTMMGVK